MRTSRDNNNKPKYFNNSPSLNVLRVRERPPCWGEPYWIFEDLQKMATLHHKTWFNDLPGNWTEIFLVPPPFPIQNGVHKIAPGVSFFSSVGDENR